MAMGNADCLRNWLPGELDIKDEEIQEFLRTLKPPDTDASYLRPRAKQAGKGHSFPADWEQLLDRDDPTFERAREKFSQPLNRRLGAYLVGDTYRQWPKRVTYRLVQLPDDPNEKKKLGNVIGLFIEWRFIEWTDGGAAYRRVDDGLPYLKRLLAETGSA